RHWPTAGWNAPTYGRTLRSRFKAATAPQRRPPSVKKSAPKRTLNSLGSKVLFPDPLRYFIRPGLVRPNVLLIHVVGAHPLPEDRAIRVSYGDKQVQPLVPGEIEHRRCGQRGIATDVDIGWCRQGTGTIINCLLV